MAKAEIIDRIKRKIKEKDVIDRLSRTFRVLGDPTRVCIISALLDTELCVAEIADILGMSHSAISHQMRALKDLELVKCRRDGKKAFYTLSDEHIRNLFKEGMTHVLER